MARARSGSEPRTSRGPREAPAPGSRIGAWAGKRPGRGGQSRPHPSPPRAGALATGAGLGGAKAGQHRPRTAPAPPTLGGEGGAVTGGTAERGRRPRSPNLKPGACASVCGRGGVARVLTGWCQRRRAPRRGRSSSSKPESGLLVWGSFNCSKLHTLRPFKFLEVS